MFKVFFKIFLIVLSPKPNCKVYIIRPILISIICKFCFQTLSDKPKIAFRVKIIFTN